MSEERLAPPVDLLRGLAVLAEPPTEEHRRLTEALGLPGAPSPADHAELFVFQLYPHASVHLGPEGMMGGETGARIAGFWRALGHEPPSEPDHLASLLGLYASLAEAEVVDAPPRRTGAAPEDPAGGPARTRLLIQARRALLHEHLAPWVFAFADRVRELAGDRGYGAWAELLGRTLREEVESGYETPPAAGRGEGERHEPLPSHVPGEARGGLEGLPVHLRAAPALPDPRREGAAAFLSGLLAPVRSGMILARADLARMAGTLDLGLRAGERRYALEHLLAQDAPRTLEALAREARRQGGLHSDRVPWLGATASFHERRAVAAADLLDDLARETPPL